MTLRWHRMSREQRREARQPHQHEWRFDPTVGGLWCCRCGKYASAAVIT